MRERGCFWLIFLWLTEKTDEFNNLETSFRYNRKKAYKQFCGKEDGMGEKVYITGINGFLGRTLAGKLLEAGCEVCGLRLLQDDRDLLTEVHL